MYKFRVSSCHSTMHMHKPNLVKLLLRPDIQACICSWNAIDIKSNGNELLTNVNREI